MYDFFKIIAGTPWWAWLILLLVLSRGVKALKTSTTPLVVTFFIPAILLIIGMRSLLMTYGLQPYPAMLWLGSLVLGSLIGWLLTRNKYILFDKKKKLIQVPGSSVTLILLLTVFGAHYYFNYNIAINPNIINTLTFMVARLTVSGVISGLFVGRLLCYLNKYYTAEHQDLFL